MQVVCVRFDLKPECFDSFMPLMTAQADTSVRVEPGCIRFDVCSDRAASTVFLYEIYTDRAAFDAHLATDHFLVFDAAVAEFVVLKSVELFALDMAAPGYPSGGGAA